MFYRCKPEFNSNMVLKSELLQESTDYAMDMFEHIYGAYSDGIIEGTEVFIEEPYIVVRPGIIKHNGILYHMKTETRIRYEHNHHMTFLRVRFEDVNRNNGMLQYTTELILTTDEMVFPYEMELGRFISEPGAILRSDVSGLSLLSPQYNQFDIRFVPYAGIGKSTISPRITIMFSRELIARHTENIYDAAFAMQGLSHKTMEREVIYAYLSERTGKNAYDFTNEEICQSFLQILKKPIADKRQPLRQNDRRIIID